ncbi:MAG: hypothetical protein HY828_07325 [Actinobacteria bacterium]|nr:hypothetical protein [Actinomycetota bacterium]
MSLDRWNHGAFTRRRISLLIVIGLCIGDFAFARPPVASATEPPALMLASAQASGAPPDGSIPPPIPTDGVSSGEVLRPSTEPPSMEPPAEVPHSTLGDPVAGKQAPPSVKSGVSGFDPARSTADPAQRSRFVTVFENPDGTRSATFGSEAQNYLLPNGRWVPIDPRLLPVAGQPGMFSTAASSMSLTVSSAGVEIRGESGGLITMVPGAGAVRLPVPVISADGLTATYSEVWPGVDVRFRVTNATVAKEIVLKSPSAPSSFDVAVTGVELAQDASSKLAVVGSSDFGIGQVEVLDKAGTPVNAQARPSQRLRAGGSKASPVVSLGVDPAWLGSLPAEAFPVVFWIRRGTTSLDWRTGTWRGRRTASIVRRTRIVLRSGLGTVSRAALTVCGVPCRRGTTHRCCPRRRLLRS